MRVALKLWIDKSPHRPPIKIEISQTPKTQSQDFDIGILY
jgi:hypothetical protein